jgi:hypothetical protein
MSINELLALKQIKWKELDKQQKRTALTRLLKQYATKSTHLSQSQWNQRKPAWCPVADTVAGIFDTSWTELIQRHGMQSRKTRHANKNKQKQTTKCDCGQEAQHSIPITQLMAGGNTIVQYLQLCDGCKTEFEKIEQTTN